MNTKIPNRPSARLWLIVILTGLGALSLVSVILLGLLSYRTQRAVSDRMDRIAAIAQMQSLLKDAETGERGYLITEDTTYLAPYTAARTRLPQQIRITRELFRAVPERSKIVETVIARTEYKLYTLATAIRVAHNRGFEAARIATRQGTGQRIMNEARDLTGAVIGAERRDQDRDLRALGGWQTAFYLAAAVMVLLVSFLLVSALLESMRALRDAESESEGKSLLLSEVLEASPDLIFVKDMDGRYTHANRATLAVMGRSSALGLKDSEIYPESVWRKIVTDDRQTMAENRPYTFEESVVPQGGASRRYFLTTKVILRDAAGAAKGLLGVSKDISERKDAEEKQKLLINELNHRVKNTLAVLHSIALQTFKGTDKSRIDAFEGRLQSLSAAHNILTRHR